MSNGLNKLKINPTELLLSCGNVSIEYFTRFDLLDDRNIELEDLWELPAASKILRKQRKDGSWKYPGKIRQELRSTHDYDQLETFRMLGELVEKYGFNNQHPNIQDAAKFLFDCQTPEGDFRGIYSTQYAPTYSAAIMELLIKTGYNDDPRIEKGLKWLLSQRQEDGGWAIPTRTHNINYKEGMALSKPIKADKTRPFSHLVTGMVLRAFAAHPKYKNSDDALFTGNLMVTRLFKSDKYPDRRNKNFWEKVSYPFWFTDVVSVLDSLSIIGFKPSEPNIRTSLQFLIDNQNLEGLFNLKLLKIKDKDLKYWICLAIGRIFKRFYHG